MRADRDYDGTWFVPGYEHLHFSTESDANRAIELAAQFAAEQQVLEFRYRRASDTSKETI